MGCGVQLTGERTGQNRSGDAVPLQQEERRGRGCRGQHLCRSSHGNFRELLINGFFFIVKHASRSSAQSGSGKK